MNMRNHEHYPDPTASMAVNNADNVKHITSSYGFEVAGKNAVIRLVKDIYGKDLAINDLQFVWFGYIDGDMKAKLYCHGLGNIYPEVTYNKKENRLTVDFFKKDSSILVENEDFNFYAKSNV